MPFALQMHFKEDPVSDDLVLTHNYYFHVAHILVINVSVSSHYIQPKLNIY